VLSVAAFGLRAQGRFAEALPAMRSALQMLREARDWVNAAAQASNLSECELSVGEVAIAAVTAEQSIAHADQSRNEYQMMSKRATHADALHAAGRYKAAEHLFLEAERRQKERQPKYPLLYSLWGNRYCDLLLANGKWTAARDRAIQTLEWASSKNWLLDISLDMLTLGRAHLGLALYAVPQGKQRQARDDVVTARTKVETAIDGLRAAGQLEQVARGLLVRTAFHRSVGDWDGAARDLDEVEEIAEPGPMRLNLCDVALERARLAFAPIVAFAPLNGLIDDSPPQPVEPPTEEGAKLVEEARVNLVTARDLIEQCGYHRRDEELAELEAVLRGERRFADLPPRV
jgi:hypothetical protein